MFKLQRLVKLIQKTYHYLFLKRIDGCKRILKWNDAVKFLFCFFIILNAKIVHAVITIESISTTVSTCNNNGTATIIATSNKENSILFYSIIAGPTLAPIQNGPLFPSLFPGTYTVRVYDVDFKYKEQKFTISGNYQLPELNPILSNPTCVGTSTGTIIGNAVNSKGKAPFKWELIYPTSTTIQTNDIFTNLNAGTYTIKLTDDCGNYQTRTAILLDRGTGLAHRSDGVPTIFKIGCDTMVYNMEIKILKSRAKDPLTVTLTQSNGPPIVKLLYPIPIDTVNYNPGLYVLRDTLHNVTYNEYLHACVKDICGYEICATRDSIAPYDFDVKFNTINSACNFTQVGSVVYKTISATPYMKTSYKPPLSLTLEDASTNVRIDSTGCNTSFCTLSIKNGIAGKMYNMRITDGCGAISQQNILWPNPIINPAAVNVSIGKGCLDSSSVANFNFSYFGGPITLSILSGPSSVSSTKPAYTFSYPISYPKTYFANVSTQFSIKNMSTGKYTYRVTDTCGTVVNGTFVIEPINLNSIVYTYSLKKGCAGDNILFFNPTNSNASGIVITNLSTNIDLYKRTGGLISDSLTSLQPGKYLLAITYQSNSNASITDTNTDCWVLTDTIRIENPSTNADFKSHTSILCNNINYVEINADSSYGLAPYQYEISMGPQTFPLQNSNVFQLSTYGDYTIRIRDACGNSNARQISVDLVTFAPILKVGANCRGNRISLKAISSSFFEYTWERPNGTIYVGDSLIINALSPADTGIYNITKKVSINGCSDVFKTSYHLELLDVYRQTISFCEGNSVTFGTKVYKSSGTYIDTLKNIEGCDSIRVITLNMLPKKIDTVNVRICNGDQIRIGGKTYNVPGIYSDSILNAVGCYEITATKLDVNGYPDTIKTTICEGSFYQIAKNIYTLTGFYTDTFISSFGCDSIIITELIVRPLKRITLTKTICAEQTITIGTHTYNMTGVYYDTLATTTCDSLVTLDLTVLKSFAVISQHDVQHCFDEGPLTITANAAQSFLWMPSGESTQGIEITQEGTYSVTATDINACAYTEQIHITDFCETKIFVPTGFTPNDDGLHDDVEIFGKHFTNFKITIFNRWGEIIFISTDRDVRWDGRYRGELMPAGTYPWIITYTSTLNADHSDHALNGSITLVR